MTFIVPIHLKSHESKDAVDDISPFPLVAIHHRRPIVVVVTRRDDRTTSRCHCHGTARVIVRRWFPGLREQLGQHRTEQQQQSERCGQVRQLLHQSQV